MNFVMRKIVTWLTYDPTDFVYTPDPVSVTVPDMSYSLRDLLERFTTGTIPTDLVRAAMYTDNPDFDDFLATELGDFDLSDYAREVSKLRELHSIRMERKKAANDDSTTIDASETPSDESPASAG